MTDSQAVVCSIGGEAKTLGWEALSAKSKAGMQKNLVMIFCRVAKPLTPKSPISERACPCTNVKSQLYNAWPNQSVQGWFFLSRMHCIPRSPDE